MANYNPPTNGFDKRRDDINRKGAPEKPWTFAGLLRDAMDAQNLDGEPIKKAVAQALVDKALTQDVQAIREIANRIDGMPVQKNVLTGDEDNPIKVDISGLLLKAYGQDNSSAPTQMLDDSE